LIASIERLGTSLSTETKLQMWTAEWSAKSELGCGESSGIRLASGSEATLSAVKFAETASGVQLIQREVAIHKELKHPLIFNFRASNPGRFGPSTIVTEITRNRSLVNYLLSAEGNEMNQLRGETWVVKLLSALSL
jgi:hypothetical protein